MKRNALKAGFAVSALALAISPAMAAELRFDGFASFVAGQVLDKDELAEGDSFRGFNERLDTQENSLFAIQMRADLMDKLSATAQIIAKGSEGYDARFNWAYLTYELNDNITIKAGRVRSPLFMYSDFLDVGYAYHWISPPDSVYDLSGFDSGDGVMVEYHTDIGAVNSLVSATYGGASANVEDGTLDTNRNWTLSWTVSYEWLTFHLAHSQGDITVQQDQFDLIKDGLSQAGVSQDAIDDMVLESDIGAFDGVGLSIDTGSFFAVAEYTQIASEDAFAADPQKNWYVSAGVRFGDWTTYATVENVQADINEKQLAAITDQLDPTIAFLASQIALFGPTPPAPGTNYTYDVLAASYDGLNELRGGVTQIFGQTEQDEDVYSVGVRYNFHPSATFKAEYTVKDDHVTDLKPSTIAFAVDLVY